MPEQYTLHAASTASPRGAPLACALPSLLVLLHTWAVTEEPPDTSCFSPCTYFLGLTAAAQKPCNMLPVPFNADVTAKIIKQVCNQPAL